MLTILSCSKTQEPRDLPLPSQNFSRRFARRHFKTGKPVPVLYEFFLTEDQETGASTNFATISRDITERKRAEKALIESEALFRGMFKDHIAVMLLVDPHTGQIVLANQAAAQYYGYPLENLIQMRIQQLNVLSPTKIAEKMVGAFNKQINIFEFQHLLADGQIRDVQVHSTPITVQNQIVLFSIIHDITERKQAEESLRKSEERFLLAMKATHGGLFDWNLETNDIYYSPAWKNMLGYEDHELPNDFSVWEKTTEAEDVKKSWELQPKLISKEIDRFEIEFKMRLKMDIGLIFSRG
jgi:PAS domain S-box-containing protein